MQTLKLSLKIFANVLAILILAVILSLGYKLAISAVWQEPTESPPSGQPDAPINVGSTSQTKTGALTVGGLTSSANFDKLLTLTRSGASYSTVFRLGTDSALVINNFNKDTITLKNGKVGIGTTAPGATLDVNGSVNVNGSVRAVKYYDDDTNYYADLNSGGNLGGNWNIGGLLTVKGGAIFIEGDSFLYIRDARSGEPHPGIMIGDDAWLNDIDVANTIGLRGAQNQYFGNIQFGNDGPIVGRIEWKIGNLPLSKGLKINAPLVYATGDIRTDGYFYKGTKQVIKCDWNGRWGFDDQGSGNDFAVICKDGVIVEFCAYGGGERGYDEKIYSCP